MTAVLDAPTATPQTRGRRLPTEERLGREVVIDRAQEKLDAEGAGLMRLASHRRVRTEEEQLLGRWEAAAAACGEHPLTGEPYYTVEDFRAWWQHAEELGAIPSTIGAATIGRLFRLEIVPNARLRERVQHAQIERGLTITTVASSFSPGRPDAAYAERVLGISADRCTPDRPFYRWYLKYETACAIAGVLGAPLQELGL